MTYPPRVGKLTRKMQVWVDDTLHDMCKELVDNGTVYKSMSELVRDGMQMAFDKNSGYMDLVRQEAANKHGEHDMTETRCLIDGTKMRLRINARWMAVYGANKLVPLIEDLHIPQPLSTIEEKYGTKIELYSMDQPISLSSDDISLDEGYKETYAYKEEHGLLNDND